MKLEDFKIFAFSVALLAATIIGAGIFSLPYVFRQTGLMTGVFYLTVFALIYFIIHLMYAQLLQINKGNHQFFYLTKKYLPPSISLIASGVILGELILILTIYLSLVPIFGELVFGSKGFIFLLLFWFTASLFIFARLSWLGLAELFGLLSIFLILIILIFMGFSKPFLVPLFKKLHWSTFFLPFGPLLFSLAGRPAISKIGEFYHHFQNQKKQFPLRSIIFLGTILPALVYLIFGIAVLRLNPAVSPETFNSLDFLPPAVLLFLGGLGIVAIWTSYFIMGINLREILVLDLNWSRFFSALLVFFLPLFFYLIGLNNFLAIISLTGNIFLAGEAIFIVTMWRRAFPQNSWRWLTVFLYFVFITAFIYEIVHFFA